MDLPIVAGRSRIPFQEVLNRVADGGTYRPTNSSASRCAFNAAFYSSSDCAYPRSNQGSAALGQPRHQ